MKILIKYGLIVIASLLGVFALFGFFIDETNSKWYGIILLLFLSLPMLYFGLKIKIEPKQVKIKKQKQTKEIKQVATIVTKPIKEVKTKTIVPIEQNTFNQAPVNFRYSSQMISGKIFQTLETIEIIETTKNLDTLQSRYKFLLTIYDDIKAGSLHPIYANDFQKALDNYKQLYYNKIPTQNQLIALAKPLEFELGSFYYISTYQCFVRGYDFQMQQIEVLKTEKGKQGRYKKLLEELHLAKDVVAPEILNNENAKLIFDKLIEIESLLKSKLI